MSDKWLFGFITVWIILCAGEPDLIDSINKRIANVPTQEVIEK